MSRGPWTLLTNKDSPIASWLFHFHFCAAPWESIHPLRAFPAVLKLGASPQCCWFPCSPVSLRRTVSGPGNTFKRQARPVPATKRLWLEWSERCTDGARGGWRCAENVRAWNCCLTILEGVVKAELSLKG